MSVTQIRIAALLEEIATLAGSPVVVVNNAGVTRDNLLLRMKAEEWDTVVNTNLNSMYRVCKACLKGMRPRRVWPHYQYLIRRVQWKRRS